jgi:hypothetical protein
MGGEAQATTAAAYTSSSNGRQVRVSVRLRPQPSESYVHMETEDTLLQQPWVLAACGDLLLVQMFVRDDAATRDLVTAREIWFPAGNRISRPPPGIGLTG